MRTIEVKNKTIMFDGKECRATWTDKVQDDLMNFHGLDIRTEIAQALVQEIDREFNLTDEEKEDALVKLKEYL